MGESRSGGNIRINDTRWTVGWNPLTIIVPLVIVAAALAILVELEPDQILVCTGLAILAGLAVWYWGVAEVNSKYNPLIRNFRHSTRQRVANETGGINVNSMYSFINFRGSSPPLVEPARKYDAAHIVFGDTSVLINEEFEYHMEDRTPYRGGEQAELFYDQISNVRSENYKNRQTLQISLSSGQVAEIPSTDPDGVTQVKSELQQKIRAARRT